MPLHQSFLPGQRGWEFLPKGKGVVPNVQPREYM